MGGGEFWTGMGAGGAGAGGDPAGDMDTTSMMARKEH